MLSKVLLETSEVFFRQPAMAGGNKKAGRSLLNRLDYPAAAPVRAIIRPALFVRQSVVSLSR